MIKRDSTIKKLSEIREEVGARFKVKSLAIFGSVARNEAEEGSDLDVLVDFEGPATFDNYMDLKFFLEDLLQVKVDLVTQKALRPQLRPYVEKELVFVA